MNYAVEINISGEGAEVPARVLRAISPDRLRPVMGRAAVIAYRTHLRAKNASSPNKLGGRRTHFYAAAARATSFALVGDSTVVVSIAQRGISQRYFGGRIVPVKAKLLAIPAHPLAHGKLPREFPDLEMIFGAGGRPVGLAQKPQGTRQFGVFLFRLTPFVDQKPDPTVLPELSAVGEAVSTAVVGVVNRAAGGDQAAPSTPSA